MQYLGDDGNKVVDIKIELMRRINLISSIFMSMDNIFELFLLAWRVFNTVSKINIFSFFSTKVNSIFLEPVDEPFKSPVPFNNNLGACSVGISYLFLFVYIIIIITELIFS